MFPREQRLRRHRDIQQILKTGLRLSTPALMLRYLPNRRTKPRVTVVVGTTVSKRAVVRNRLKRQLRHVLMAELKGRSVGFDPVRSSSNLSTTSQVTLPKYKNAIVQRPHGQTSNGVDLMLSVRASALDMTPDERRRVVHDLLHRARII